MAGTRTRGPDGKFTLSDWANDVRIPFSQTRSTPRGKAAEQYAQLYKPTRVVGHSLGGSVALDVAKDHGISSTTYGAPVVSASSGDRYRDYLDPFSMLDFGATNRLSTPHSYSGYSRRG